LNFTKNCIRLIDKFTVKIEKGKKQEKKVITVAASDKDCMLGMVSKLIPERYKPIAQTKRMVICFKVFVFIIGGNYKLILNIDISNLQ
jgi:hypothetical protein